MANQWERRGFSSRQNKRTTAVDLSHPQAQCVGFHEREVPKVLGNGLFVVHFLVELEDFDKNCTPDSPNERSRGTAARAVGSTGASRGAQNTS